MLASIRWAAATVIVLSSLTPAAAQDGDGDGELLRVEVDLVTINVSVLDGGKRPVAGLRAADFHVADEGRAVSLEFCEGQGPASTVFVLDTSLSMRGEKWKQVTNALKKFLARAREGDDYTLVAFGDHPRLVAESVSAEELWESVCALKPEGETALYDAVLVGLEALGRAPRRHKALVLLSDGQDTRSRARLADVEREALSRRATLYAVGITRARYPDSLPEQREGKQILEGLAAATGGLAFFPGPYDIRKVLDGIGADLGAQYTLGYYAPDGAAGWRNIQVSLAAPPRPLRLRYQQRYLKR